MQYQLFLHENPDINLPVLFPYAYGTALIYELGGLLTLTYNDDLATW